MRTLRVLAAGVTLFLTACGGGEPGSPEPAPAQRAAARPLRDLGDPMPINWAQFLAWLQGAFPEFFSGPSADGTFAGYDFRRYTDSNNYVGLNGNSVYILGPASNQQILHIGALERFTCVVNPALCRQGEPLSALQSQFEAGLADTGWFPVKLTGDTGGAFVRRQLTTSPATVRGDGAASLTTESAAFGGRTDVANAYINCGGATASDGTYYVFDNRYLDESGRVGRFCSGGPHDVFYWGDGVYIRLRDGNVSASGTYRVTQVETTELAGQRVSLSFPFVDYVAGGATAVFPAGTRRVRVYAQLLRERVYVHDRSIGTAIPAGATRLEDAFPYSGYCCTSTSGTAPLTMEQGSIRMINGRRVWSTLTTGATDNALIEIDGRIYAGRHYVASSTARLFSEYYNAAARDTALGIVNR